MRKNMRYMVIAALLMVTSMAWGYNVTIVDGITNGTITASSSTANETATVTLTVTPSDGYYITANDITITQTGSGSMAQTRTNPDIAETFHPVAGTINAEGKGTYTFVMPVSNVKIEATFTARTVVSDATVTLSATNFTYNGSVQKPTVTSVKKNETTYLASGSTNGYADYDVSIPNGINATDSPFTVNVTFRGKYTGTASADYYINQASINNVDIAVISDQTYTGSVIEPTPAVTLGDYTLVAETDFSYSYTTDHTNVGAKVVTVTGLNGNFDTATKTQDYNITVKAITNVNIAAISDQTYTGSALTPEPVVTDPDRGTTPLVKGTDYTVAYSANNTDVTNAVTVTITGMGNYDSNTTATTTFKIVAATLDATALNDKITLSATTFPYDGSAHTPTVTITGLTEDTDFTVKYKKGTDAATTTIPTDAGTYTIVISGMGNYTGEAVTNKSFEITKVASSVTTAPTAIEDLVYNGSNQALINNDGVATNGTLHYSLDGTSYSTTIPTGKDVKAYTVYYKVVGDENHADTDPVTIPVSIAKKDITISGIKAKNKEYDGGTTATLDYTSVVFTGIEDGDALTVSATGTFADANVGDGIEVALSNLSLGGTSIANYKLAATGQQTSTTANITAAALDASTLNTKITLSSTSIGYTGEPVAPTVTIEGMTEGTDYDVKYKNGDAEATATKPTNNGTYTIVIVGKGNYAGEVVTSKTFQITKAAAAVATAPTAKENLVYTGGLQDLITAGKGANGTMQYSLDNKTYTTAIPQGKAAKDYTIYYKVVGDDNYADTEVATLSVTIAAATLDATTLNNKTTLSSASFEYSDEAQAPTVTIEGMTEGTDFTVKYKKGDDEATAEKPKEAGTYTVVIVGMGNYSGEIVTDKTFTIEEPKPEIVDNSKPVTVGGETLYELTTDILKAIENTIKASIALPAAADTRTTVTTAGALSFSKGTDLDMAVRNLKRYDLVKFIFTGNLYGDSSRLRLKGSATRGTRAAGDMKLTSGATYEVMTPGDMIVTLKLGEEEATLTSISVTTPSTGIDAVEVDDNTDQWFDLNGRRIDKPTKKGVYIRNGQKIVTK